jgi:hypothetical protein
VKRILLFTSIVAALSCAGAPKASNPAAAEPEERTPTLSSEAAVALVTCRDSLDDIETKPRDERVAFAVETCRGIWLEQSCAQSFDLALELESYERAGLIMRSCRDAYCPSLSAELALCQATLSNPVSLIEPLDDPGATDPLKAWAQFNSAIFVRDYGADPDEQLLSGFPSMLLQLVIVAPPRVP